MTFGFNVSEMWLKCPLFGLLVSNLADKGLSCDGRVADTWLSCYQMWLAFGYTVADIGISSVYNVYLVAD